MEGIQGTPESRERLSQLMNDRRQELRVRWAEVARRAGMAVQNLGRIRRGAISISWEAAEGIERALCWARGSVERIVLEHGEPVLLEAAPAAPAPAIVLTEEDNRRFAVIKELFRSWGTPMTPRMLEVWHDEIGRQASRRRPSGSDPTTEGARSDEDGSKSPDRGIRE